MAAFGEVTRLMTKMENEPIRKIVVKKTTGVKKKAAVTSVKEKETTASKNWQRDRHTDEKIAHHVSKLESEFHQKLRLMEEKYNTRITGLEKRTKELESANEKQEDVIMELLKRIHTTHKQDKTELEEKIEKLEGDIEKATSSHKATIKALDKTMAKADARISSHKKEMTNLMYKVDNLDRRIDNRIRDHSHDDESNHHRSRHSHHHSDDEHELTYRSDSSVSPMKSSRGRDTPLKKKKKKKKVTIKEAHDVESPYKYSRPHRNGAIPLQQDITALKYDFLTLQERVAHLAKKRTLSTPGTYAEPAASEEMLEQIQELQSDMNALNKHTHKALKTQDAAIMCLYKNSDFKMKSKVTPTEMIEVFGRLNDSEESLHHATSMFGVSPSKKRGGGHGGRGPGRASPMKYAAHF